MIDGSYGTGVKVQYLKKKKLWTDEYLMAPSKLGISALEINSCLILLSS